MARPTIPLADDCTPLKRAADRGELELIAYGRGQYPGTRLASDVLPGLRSMGCWDAVGPQSWGLPMHRNEGIEICQVLHGELVFLTDTERHLLCPGDITITRPWQRHQLGDPMVRPSRLFWVILDVEDHGSQNRWDFPGWIAPDAGSRREILRTFRKNQRCQTRDYEQTLKPFLNDLVGQMKAEGPLVHAQIAAGINHLLLAVAQMLSEDMESPHSDPQGLNQTITHFYQDLEHSVETAAEPWTISQIAHACRVGVTYLTRSCRERFNCTPVEQLNRIRLHHASRLLEREPNLTVTEVAFKVGYNTSQYFATRFRKQYGISPQAYRSARERG